jgi:hypothetical protein
MPRRLKDGKKDTFLPYTLFGRYNLDVVGADGSPLLLMIQSGTAMSSLEQAIS